MLRCYYTCTVYTNDYQNEVFRETTEIPRMFAIRDYKNSSPEPELEKITFAKAKARIITGDINQGSDYIQTLPKYRKNDSLLEDDLIKQNLLRALLRIRRTNPVTYKNQIFEVEGFCEILGIDRGLFIFLIDLLKEEGLVAETELKDELNPNPIYLTLEGYKYISKINRRTTIVKGPENDENFEYDIVISFAGEDREVAESIKSELALRKISVFYDNDETADLWGKNLYSHLAYVYGKAGKYCLMLLSENYSKKLWTSHEREHAQARAFRENREYILPIRLDNTEIPGIAETVGYIEFDKSSAEQIADLISRKLSKLKL